MSKGKYYFSKSLEKGLKILALFTKDTPMMTQSEIAKTLGLNRTTAYRYINTLEELGYLKKDQKTKAIRPTTRCLLFCNNLIRASGHLRLLKEEVDRVHRENNISIDVVIVVDDQFQRLYHRDAEETLTYRLPNSSKNCFHNTALGKAYLSTFSLEQLKEKIDRLKLVAKTEHSIIDKKILLTELHETRTRGYAISKEEYLTGLLALGAPLIDLDSGKGLGAISFDFSVLEHRSEEIVLKYSALIVKTAKRLSEFLPANNAGV
jgi:DNA-binding IclR family transcriptional regulator